LFIGITKQNLKTKNDNRKQMKHDSHKRDI